MIPLSYIQEHGSNIRVHGNGFIQLDIGPDERIHLFGHPAIPRQVNPTPVHDHKFGFVSTVLSGCLVNVLWSASFSGKHTHTVCRYETGIGENTKLVPIPGSTVRLDATEVQVINPGESYMMEHGILHETFANEPTFTNMKKQEISDITPRVLCRIGQEPDNSFNRHEAMKLEQLKLIFQTAWLKAGLPV